MGGSRETREGFVEAAGDFVPFVVAERDGLYFVLPTGDPTLTKLLVGSEKHKERDVLLHALERLEGAGVPAARTTFLNIGANIGTAVFAALQAGFETVVACEPMPESVRLLRANLALNDYGQRVRVVEIAVSDDKGMVTIDASRGSRKARVVSGDRGEDTHRTRAARLDDLVAEGVVDPAPIGLVMIDVEGHEPHVLDGGGTVFGTGVPLVLDLNPRLLRRGGRLGDLGELLARSYTHVLDLRAAGANFVPVGALPILVERNAKGATDVLACRLAQG